MGVFLPIHSRYHNTESNVNIQTLEKEDKALTPEMSRVSLLESSLLVMTCSSLAGQIQHTQHPHINIKVHVNINQQPIQPWFRKCG